MKIPQYLLKSVNLLNLILMAVAGAGILCAVVPLTDVSVNVAPPPMTETNAGQAAQASSTSPAPVYLDYALIAEQNIFHPLRKIPADSKDAAIPRPEVILYGTLITDQMRIAYVEDKKSPRTTPGRGKRQIALKKGETLSGFVLKEVEKDRIELVKGNDRIVVYLSDQNKVRSEEKSRSTAPAGSPQPAVPPRPQPTVQPRAMQAGPPPAVQPRAVPASPQPMVQPRIMPSGPQVKTTPSQ